MAVYIVTGKLGAGKTLLAVQKIQEYLKQGRPVAVNIDVRMEKLCRPGNRYSRVVRLPDLPTADDLLGLGYGCEQYDEEKFGGIFLDEAGVWLNSRDWNQGGRTDLLKFFLHLRKRRWDLWLLVQNVGVIDKQIRESIAEFVVYLTRWDRVKIPLVTPIGRMLTLGIWKGRLPKWHYALVKYGAKANALKADEWYFSGKTFYSFYDTTQEYDSGYDKGAYSLLPPGYLRPRWPVSPRTWGFLMRTTRIFFKRTRVINAFLLGLSVAGVLVGLFVWLVPIEQVPVANVGAEHTATPAAEALQAPPKPKLAEEFAGLRVSAFLQVPEGQRYVFKTADGRRLTTADLEARGIIVQSLSPSQAFLIRGADYLSIYR